MSRRYPSEFSRRVPDLLAAGRSVAQVAAELQISEQAIDGWRRQHLIDTGQLPGLTRRTTQSWSRPVGGSLSWRRSWRSPAGLRSC